MYLDSSSLLGLFCIAYSVSVSRSFISPTESYSKIIQNDNNRIHQLSTRIVLSSTIEDTSSSTNTTSSLPSLYPEFASVLSTNGYTTPTPIQQSSATQSKNGENILLIAATGSGKTLSYLLPALSRVKEQESLGQRSTVLVVAPTRELAAQLARDASLLIPDINEDQPNVLLAVRGIPPPSPSQLSQAIVLIGTPNELYAVLTRISGAQNFIAGDTLSNLILDEVDVLLPPTPKSMRTTFDKKNGAQAERKKLEQKRKLRAAQRRGVEFQGGASIKGKSIDTMDLSNSMNSQVLTPTERVLRLIASGMYVGEQNKNDMSLQVLAGSATASRATLDRLNKALRWAAMEGGVIGGGEGLEGVWKGRMKACRPNIDDDGGAGPNTDPDESTHTIRAVTVPSVVDHRYVYMSKEEASNAHEILSNVAKVTEKLQPKSSLVFICGEFSRSVLKEKKREMPKVRGNTAQSRRNAKKRSAFIEKQMMTKNASGNKSTGPEPLSVRKACSILQSMGVNAQPMHVALGLEPNASEGGEEDIVLPVKEENNANEVELPPVLVTFEGSARGLHFDGVDVVFVVGRPTSAMSYLHLAGRIGRAMSDTSTSEEGTSGEVEIRPGTIVSFCSKGRVTEMEKWTNQVGATNGLEEIVL